MPDSLGRGRSDRRFAAVVIAGWLVLGLLAAVYARMKGIPAWTAVPVAIAFLIEFPFYLLPGFAPARLGNPWALALSCVIPYLAYSVPTGDFRLAGLFALFGIAMALSFWFRILPESRVTDFAFLGLAAAVYLSKIFDRIYLAPIPKVMPFLGHVMLIRTAAIAILAIRDSNRGNVQAEFRFLPTGPEWLAGLRWSAPLLAASAAALWSVGLWKPRPHPNLALAIPQFLGILFVVAISEEFVFRGLLQQWLEDSSRNRAAALLVTSIVFGSAHLGFHGVFPNWRFAIVAAIFGLFCGLAWRERKSVQASMVAHAIGATMYRVFFQ